MDSHSDVGCGRRGDAPVTGGPTSLSSSSGATRSRRRYAFGGDSIFVDVGCYLGCSLCSLAELVCQAGTASPSSGSTPAAAVDPRVSATPTAHRAAVLRGGGTMAGLLHRNVIACGFTDTAHC
jgi:hypothetical protein